VRTIDCRLQSLRSTTLSTSKTLGSCMTCSLRSKVRTNWIVISKAITITSIKEKASHREAFLLFLFKAFLFISSAAAP
jgi:hypothetical protein